MTSDLVIWDTTWDSHPFFPWEWWLADLGYVGAHWDFCTNTNGATAAAADHRLHL